MAASPAFIGSIKDAVASLVNADGTAFKTLLTAGASGSRLKALSICSSDTVARTLQLCKTIGAVDYVIGEIIVPIGAGTNGTEPAVNALDPAIFEWLQTDGINYFMELGNGCVLKVRSKVAVTAAQVIHLAGEYGDV